MKRIVRKRQLFDKKIVLNIILVLFMFLSIGYSTLSTSLNINGNLNVKKYYEKTLYNVLAKEAETGGLAKKYTGEHHDSFTEEPSKNIYYWSASKNGEADRLVEMNNVIFAEHCWQMLRTTDTGGVKMIYNGVPENNKCLDTRENHVGYAGRPTQNLASSYWYGTDYTYDSSNKTFKISGTTEEVTWNDTTGPGLIGKYTCKNPSIDATCETLYLVESYKNTTDAILITLKSDSHYSQFGKLSFNKNSNSPADVGYMYNTRYTYNSKQFTFTEEMLKTSTLSTSFWYSHNAVWGNPTGYRYNLDNPYQIADETGYPNLVGEYTFKSDSQTTVSYTVLYIAAVKDSTMYYIQLGTESGTTHELSYYNHTYTFGDTYTDNGNGTYTINNPTTINRSDWYTNYNNIGKGKYICKNTTNNTCSELWYTTETTDTKMSYILVNNNFKYAKGFTWDGNKYILNNDSVTFWNISDETNKSSLNNAHYTCFNETGACETISYIYFLNGTTELYINLNEGKSVDDALVEMLKADDVNRYNSIIKSGVDAWYKHYMLDYDDKIEDTIYCNDRSIRTLNGWDPNGGNLLVELYFGDPNSLLCNNSTDSFSIYNNKAKLVYKVGLMSFRELNLLPKILRGTRNRYWNASPNRFYQGGVQISVINTDGSFHFSYADTDGYNGIRPAISLKPNTKYVDGDGSKANPYIVDTNNS